MNARHLDLARELAEGIASGRHPVGSLLPTEFELCEQFGASRYAVRKALDELQELGLISRRKNVGTRVEAARPAAGFTQQVATVGELVQYGAEHERTLRGVSANELTMLAEPPTGTGAALSLSSAFFLRSFFGMAIGRGLYSDDSE